MIMHYHNKTMNAFKELLGAAGLQAPKDIQMSDISRRDHHRVVDLPKIYQQTPELSPHEKRADFEPRPKPAPPPPKPTH